MAGAAALPWARHGLRWPQAVVALLDHCPVPACDFARIYLPQAQALSSSPGAIHPKWFYPPLLAVLLQPLAALEPLGALATWLALQGLAVVALGVLAWRFLAPAWGRAQAAALAFGLVTLALPAVHAVKWGQVSLFLTLAIYAGLVRAGWRGGAWLGLAGAVKVYPLAFLIPALARRDGRAVLAAAGVAVLAGVALPVVLLGEAALPFFARPASPAISTQWPALGAQTLQASLFRWFEDGRHVGLVEDPRPLLFALPGPAVAALGVAGAAAVVGLTAWGWWRDRDPRRRALLVMTAAGLLIPPSWHHYHGHLPLAWAYVLGRCARRPPLLALGLLAWAASAAPLLLLTDAEGVYFRHSAWGGTTLSALLTLGGLLALGRGGEDPPEKGAGVLAVDDIR